MYKSHLSLLCHMPLDLVFILIILSLCGKVKQSVGGGGVEECTYDGNMYTLSQYALQSCSFSIMLTVYSITITGMPLSRLV